jgi:hypothetical protein
MEEVPMRCKALWLVFALVLIIGVVAGLIQRTRRVIVTTDVARVEADIREHLPMGSSRADVESYLDQRGISHSYVAELKEAPELNHTETAMIRESSRTWLVRGDIQILFKFDGHGKLIKHSAKEILTGP